MLVQAFINIAYGLLTGLVTLFPVADSNINNFLSANFAVFRTTMSGVNSLIDIQSLFLVLGVVIGTESVLMLFHFTKWIITNISFGIFKK
jgi:hypothetical protein